MPIKTKTIYLRSIPISTVLDNGFRKDGGATWLLPQSREGNKNPFWRVQVKARVSATTAMSASGLTASFHPGQATGVITRPPPGKPTYESVSGDIAAHFMSAYHPFVGNPTMGSQSARNQALTRLHNAIRQQTTSFQAGVALGELRETVRSVRDITRRLANLSDLHLKTVAKRALAHKDLFTGIPPYRGQGRKLDLPHPYFRDKWPKYTETNADRWRKLRQGLADDWLQFSFGARPLISDVKAAAETMARIFNDSKHVKVRGFGEKEQFEGIQHLRSGWGSVISFALTDVHRQRCQVVYRAGLEFSLSSPAAGSAARMRDLFGFNLESFVPTIWNLMPYSFLVDYVSNVGDLLTCLTTDLSSVRWVNETVITHREFSLKGSCYPTGGVGAPNYQVGGDIGYANFGSRTVVRVPSSAGIPTPEFNIPGLTNEYKGESSFNQQWLNLVALAHGGAGARRGF